MRLETVRVLRTPSSERYLLMRDGTEIGGLDLHYLQRGAVQATLVIFEGVGVKEDAVPEILTHLDEVLLPEVRLEDQNLIFTVVIGRVLGAYKAEPDTDGAVASLNRHEMPS
jgi:hypothetical protein